MAARDLRYSFFDEVLQREGYDYVATAHHLNDTIETIFINLVRGTGIDGLVGIPAKKGSLIRPLIFATRKMLAAYATDNHLSWRDDASNFSDDYQRNFLRHQIIPRLEEINPNFEETFRDTHARILGTSNMARSFLKQFETSAVKERGDKTEIDIRKVGESPSPMVVLWELIKALGFNFDQCRNIVSEHQPGKLFFSATHQLLTDRTHYIIEPKRATAFAAVSIDPSSKRAGDRAAGLNFKEVSSEEFKLQRNAAVAQLDADELRYPLLWRGWKAGDYFTPLGMSQEKKLSDFLIDLKMPFNEKADVTVIESAGNIVWVVGLRISERFKVNSGTRRILIIEQTDKDKKKN
jgi:tRNA(Ile)-lysidine synthase